MPGSGTALFRIDSRNASAGRLVLRADAGDRTQYLVISRYQGPMLPATLTDPVVGPLGEAGPPPRAWRLTSAEGQFEFHALAIDAIDEWPALYQPLHRPFALRSWDRLAVRVLLWLLRLPGGAALLRRWHANRR
jgi:hypothetical protein